MNYSSFPSSYDPTSGKVIGEFNSLNFNENNYDLTGYPKLAYDNFFTGVNYFSDLFATNINGVSSTVFPLLVNLTDDVQDKLDLLSEQVYSFYQDIEAGFSTTSLTVDTNLTLGTETTDGSGNLTDSGGNIVYKLAGNTYTITPQQMITLPSKADKNISNIFTEDNTFQNNIILGTEEIVHNYITDASGNITDQVNYIDSGGNIIYNLAGTQYTIEPKNLLTLNQNTTNIASFISSSNSNFSYINSQLIDMINSLSIGNVKTVSSSSKADANIYVNPNNPHNWILDLSIPKGSSPSDSNSSDAGGFLGSLGSAIAGGIVGGVVSVGLSSLINSLNQAGFQTAEDLANGIDQAKDDWQIAEMQKKLQYQDSSSLSNTTQWTSDLLIINNVSDQNGNLLTSDNPIRLKTSGEIDCSKIVCSSDAVIEGLTQVSNLNISHNISSSLKLGNNTNNYAEATISYVPNNYPNILSSENVGTLNLDASNINVGSNVASNTINIGSTYNFSTVNIGGLNTNINGILTINGIPYTNYNQFWNFSNGYFSQTGI